jgi:hypothetical protein
MGATGETVKTVRIDNKGRTMIVVEDTLTGQPAAPGGVQLYAVASQDFIDGEFFNTLENVTAVW